VAGFLFTEGIISRPEDLVALRMPEESARHTNFVRVTLDPSVRLSVNNAPQRFSVGSACGACGKASIAQLRRRGSCGPEAASLFDPEILCQLPPRLRAAALFAPGGELLVLGEDIGRHNAVDKVIGWALLDGRVPLSGQVFARGDRLLRDLLPTATADHIPLPASVSAPSESRGTTGAPTTIDTGRFSARAAPRRLRQRGADRGYRFGIGRRPPQE
jgi:FdhD protein